MDVFLVFTEKQQEACKEKIEGQWKRGVGKRNRERRSKKGRRKGREKNDRG
jgi:hypothetical protein